MNMLTNASRIAGSLALAIVASACGASSNTASSDERIEGSGHYRLPASSDARLFLDASAGRNAAATAYYPDRDISEALPGTLVSVNGGEARPASSALVAGDVVSVEPGAGFAVERDSASGTPVAFDSGDAAWRIVIVTVKAGHYVRRESGSLVDGAQDVAFGVVITGPDYQRQMQGIRDLGNVAVVLDTDRTHRLTGKTLPAVARNGALFGDVDSAGRVAFPVIAVEDPAYASAVETVDELVASAMSTEKTIRVTMGDGMPTRSQ